MHHAVRRKQRRHIPKPSSLSTASPDRRARSRVNDVLRSISDLEHQADATAQRQASITPSTPSPVSGTRDGDTLSPAERNLYQGLTQSSLEDVHIHHGSQATQLAEQHHANAFTQGKNVYFNQGLYQPNSRAGRSLIAHELTHTAQASKGTAPASAVLKQDKDAPNAESEFGAPKGQRGLGDFQLQLDPSLVPQNTAANSKSIDPTQGSFQNPAHPLALDPSLPVPAPVSPSQQQLLNALSNLGLDALGGRLSVTTPTPTESLLDEFSTSQLQQMGYNFGAQVQWAYRVNLDELSAPYIEALAHGYNASIGALLRTTDDYVFQPTADWLRKTACQGGACEAWILYTNDGRDDLVIHPNKGANTDQGHTAGLKVLFKAKSPKPSKKISRLGITVIDMYTPRNAAGPEVPDGADKSDFVYPLEQGGRFAGISSIDFGWTLLNNDELRIDILGSVGVDSSAWGKYVQDLIHRAIKQYRFPWPDRAIKPFLQTGVEMNYRPELFNTQFLGVTWPGHANLGLSGQVGTHDEAFKQQASLDLRIACDTMKGGTGIKLSAGMFNQWFYRPDADFPTSGQEHGVMATIGIEFGASELGLSGLTRNSDDPSYKTDLHPDQQPAALEPIGEHFTDGGHHGTGTVYFKRTFTAPDESSD